MKTNITDEIRSIFDQSRSWLKLELEYAKLTAAEKITLLMSSLILGFVCLLFGMVLLIMLALSLSELFKLTMCPSLAYLTTAGVVCLLLILIYMLRKPLVLNPIARLLTRVFFDKKH